MATSTAIRAQLDALVRYVQPHRAFVNCHMVGYLTENHWQTFVPADIRSAIRSTADVDDALEVFWSFHAHPERYDGVSPSEHRRFDGLLAFLRQARAHRLSAGSPLLLSISQASEMLTRIADCPPIDGSGGLHIREFMSEKKNHEVEIAAELVAALCARSNGTDRRRLSVIDAGDGKGYLSSRLALAHDLRVLGIDASATNTRGAQKRSARLERAWHGLTKRAEDERNGVKPPRKGRRRHDRPASDEHDEQPTIRQYRRSTHFITPGTDFVELFRQNFADIEESSTAASSSAFCLSGLHTCGNLAPSCMRIFEANDDIRALCNVGCCYHLLDERFATNDMHVDRHGRSDDRLDEPGRTYGFPLSAHLLESRFALGRNARMLASQSLDRCVAQQERPGRSLFFRALLEVLIVERTPERANCVQVGRMRRCPDAFVEYVRKCAQRVPDELPMAADDAGLDERCERLLLERTLDERRMDLFHLLRMTFAPVLEAIVLLDRLLFLHERGLDDAWLVQLFDAVVSPRSVAIVASKHHQ